MTQKLLQSAYFCQTTWHYCFIIHPCLEPWSSFNICLMYLQPLLPTTLSGFFVFCFCFFSLSKVMGNCEPRWLILIQKFLNWKNKDFGTVFFPHSFILCLHWKKKMQMYMSSHLSVLFTLKLFYYCNKNR